MLKGLNTIAVVCNQWGDTGKGKFVDYFGEWADIIARGTGGANAGHTINLNGKEYIFHLIPSGILHDKEGKENILGSGVAFDPAIINEELDLLERENKTYDNLYFSKDAKLLMPQHIVMDSLKEKEAGKEKIGTTKRGIGPLYTDHVARIGLKIWHMLNPEILREKIEKNIAEKKELLLNKDRKMVKEIFTDNNLEQFYSEQNIFNVDAIVKAYQKYAERFRNMITDTDNYLRASLGKKKILIEGAQGLLLDVDEGSYPKVTSSNTSVRGLANGVGLSEKDVDKTFGITKAFYMTRVGSGPFPTELGGLKGQEWCEAQTKEKEKEYNPGINTNEEFSKGIAIRLAGGEYGATTGRPRRTGWLDLPLLRHAVDINGPEVILTKIDVLSDCDEIKICDSYQYYGPERDLGTYRLKEGDTITKAYPDADILEHCSPVYSSFSGWKEEITGIKEYENLPENLKALISYVEEQAGVNARVISTGPDRSDTILK